MLFAELAGGDEGDDWRFSEGHSFCRLLLHSLLLYLGHGLTGPYVYYTIALQYAYALGVVMATE